MTFGVGIGVTISVNNVDKFIPTRTIFIENHSFNSYNDVINLVKSLDIPLIDLHEELFKSMEDPKSVIPLRSIGHFNEKGYYLVAKVIFDRINKLEMDNK